MRFSPAVWLLPLLSCTTSAVADEKAAWTERVFVAAQYLTGRWEVDGQLGNDRWKGEWTCRLVPEKMIYYITCSGARVDGNEPTQHLTRWRGLHPHNRRFFDLTHTTDPCAAAVQPPRNIKVVRNGPDEFTWTAQAAHETPLTIRFRRMRNQ